jgi:hypothetical protein
MGGISLTSSNVTAIFLRGLFQYGDLHCGHCFGLAVRGIHVFSHLRHLSFGSSWFDIFFYSFGYYDNHIVGYICYS